MWGTRVSALCGLLGAPVSGDNLVSNIQTFLLWVWVCVFLNSFFL